MALTDTRCIRKLNPSTGELIREYPAADPTQVRQAVEGARAAAEAFNKTLLSRRAQLLKTISALLYRKADQVAAIVSEETGKPISDSMEADLGTALNILNYYAGIGPRKLKPRTITPDLSSRITGRTHREIHHPRGIVGIISPWNYPLAIPASGIAAALMAGNAVILKPSELTPGTGTILIEIAREALGAQGFSKEIAQLLIGDGETGAALVESDIDGIIFTGSERTGRKIRESLGVRGLWSSMELGGSDAMIVLEGCDLEKAASYAVWGRFANAGQACASVKRLLVPAAHEETMISLLQDKVARLKVGMPTNPDAHVGPLISEDQLQILDAQVQDAIEKGARLVTGGKRLPQPGNFYAPTLLADVPGTARMLNEEVFGPALPIIPYQKLEDAIALTNRSAFGLTACVFGPADAAESIAPRLECGTVVINDVGTSNYAMVCAPWGGWKSSGSGASHGERALLELTRPQVVSQNQFFNMPFFHKPFWHFGTIPTESRTKAVLAISARQAAMLHPKTWLAFWEHRASRKL